MGYILGQKSERNLVGVHEDLVLVVQRAISMTPVDFTVLQGLRTKAQQAANVASGASTTMDSRHLTGHAVDLGALDKGKVSWHWSLYYPIARAMQVSARALDIPIVWGGVWDRGLTTLSDDLELEMAQYVLRWKGRNPETKRKGPLLDGPHFELARSKYP